MKHHLEAAIQIHQWLAEKVRKYMDEIGVTTYRQMAGLIGTSRGHIVHLLDDQLLPFQALSRIAEFFGYDLELYYKFAVTDRSGVTTIYCDNEEISKEELK